MNYRELLERYYNYLGPGARPVHKLITNHLLCFADWLNEHAQNIEQSEREGEMKNGL